MDSAPAQQSGSSSSRETSSEQRIYTLCRPNNYVGILRYCAHRGDGTHQNSEKWTFCEVCIQSKVADPPAGSAVLKRTRSISHSLNFHCCINQALPDSSFTLFGQIAPCLGRWRRPLSISAKPCAAAVLATSAHWTLYSGGQCWRLQQRRGQLSRSCLSHRNHLLGRYAKCSCFWLIVLIFIQTSATSSWSGGYKLAWCIWTPKITLGRGSLWV